MTVSASARFILGCISRDEQAARIVVQYISHQKNWLSPRFLAGMLLSNMTYSVTTSWRGNFSGIRWMTRIMLKTAVIPIGACNAVRYLWGFSPAAYIHIVAVLQRIFYFPVIIMTVSFSLLLQGWKALSFWGHARFSWRFIASLQTSNGRFASMIQYLCNVFFPRHFYGGIVRIFCIINIMLGDPSTENRRERT